MGPVEGGDSGGLEPALDASLRAALEEFELGEELLGVRALRRGHIHDTVVSDWRSRVGGRVEVRRFLHQRMNETVFPDLGMLMDNIQKVSAHMERKPGVGEDEGFEPLRLVAARDGAPFTRAGAGAWRTFHFIESTLSHDRCAGPEQAFDAARAFGWFQRQLLDLDPASLGETLPDFFSSPVRLRQLEAARKGASKERLASAGVELEFVEERAASVSRIEEELVSGRIPRRVVHGDTKLNNILFDAESGKARAIVDLDTCMAGYSLYDFGDLVRFTAATSAEDERDLSRVGTDPELYRALAEGYLSMAGGFLTPLERELMPFAARLVTLTIGMRFLADHLAGDRYFKVSRAGQNLDRARVQFGMVASMEAAEGG